MSLLRYELVISNFDGDVIFLEDFKSIDRAVRTARCFDESFVVMQLKDLLDDQRKLPIYEFIECLH